MSEPRAGAVLGEPANSTVEPRSERPMRGFRASGYGKAESRIELARAAGRWDTVADGATRDEEANS